MLATPLGVGLHLYGQHFVIETDHQPEVAAPNEEQESEVDTLGSITSTHQNADGLSPGPLDTTMVMGEV